MQTVNFQCEHCGQLMAVQDLYRGMQVRCPHCQQVVVAPSAELTPAPPPAEAPAAPPAPLPGLQETSFSVSSPSEAESIFSPPDAAAEDLFGMPAPPQVEFPSEQPVPPAPALDQWPSMEVSSATEPIAPAEMAPAASLPTMTFPEGIPETPGAPTLEFSQAAAAPEPAPTSGWPGTEPGASEGIDALPSPPRVSRRSSGWGSMLVIMLIIPLISYSIFATIAVIILYTRLQTQSRHHPLEFVPDVESDQKGSKRQKSSLIVDMPVATDPLPAHLRIPLRETIRIGDLEVTAQKVEMRQLWIHTPGSNPEPVRPEALVLRLHLKNVSDDVVFKPMDPCFDRRWKKEKAKGEKPPYTYLELTEEGRRFFGGPIPWGPPGPNSPLRETVSLREDGMEISQNYNLSLNPGEEMDTFVCTDHEDKIGPILEKYHGPLLWRVRVRRGLVQLRDREVSSTAVIGVEFTDKDIRKAG